MRLHMAMLQQSEKFYFHVVLPADCQFEIKYKFIWYRYTRWYDYIIILQMYA